MTVVLNKDAVPYHKINSQFPLFLYLQPLVDSHQASLTWSIFKQSFLKQILTEGEQGFLMSGSFKDNSRTHNLYTPH